MKPRQIKKNSKSAMDLLIRLQPTVILGSCFEYEPEETGCEYVHKNIWCFYFKQGDYYIESDDLLKMELVSRGICLNLFKRNVDGGYLFNSTNKKLIKECRQLAKAGVKFR